MTAHNHAYKNGADGEKPRILLINRLYPPRRGSGGRLTRELARALSRDGWDVHVLTTDIAPSQDMDGSVTLHRISARETISVLAGIILLARLFIKAMRLPRPDVVITLTDPPMLGVIGDKIATWRRCQHIHWVQDVYPDLLPIVGVKTPKSLYQMLYRASRRSMNRAERVVVTGRCMARYLTQHGVDPAKITLIPNWPELAMNPHVRGGDRMPGAVFDTSEYAQVLAPSILEPVPKFRVLYVGTVGFAHPVDTILDAATILDSMHAEIEFIFIGDAHAQSAISAEKERRALGNVRVLPFQPQTRLRDIMESGDLHLISMKHEAAGLMVPAKFYAALAAARPCILVGPEATEIGRIISDYNIGVVIPQRAAQSLAQAIIDYRFREDMWFTAHDGAIKASAAYTAEDMIKLWLRKVREVARAG